MVFKSNIMTMIGCLGLIIVAFFWPVFFQGNVIVPGDIPNHNPFFLAGPSPHNSLLEDEIAVYYVWHSITATTLKTDGHIPLWNPYIFTGQPLVADALSSLFYPPNILLHMLSPGKVATIRAIFNIFFAGVFTFLFCRELKISYKGSFISTIAFAFSGPMIVWLGFSLSNVLVCLPFLMWAGERLLKQNDVFSIALVASGMGLSLLGGYPASSFQVLAIFSIYFLARVVSLDQNSEQKGRLFGAFILAFIFGAIISAIQLLPFVDFMLQSSTFARGGRGTDAGGPILFYSEHWLANLSTIVTLICPNFFGNPVDNNYLWPFSNYQNYNEQSIYFGIIPLALACGALFAKSKQRPFIIISYLALFCIGVAWYLPIFEAVNHLPVFSMAPNKRLKLPFVFLAAVMAGFGYDSILGYLKSGQSQTRSFHASAAILLTTFVFYLGITILKLTVFHVIARDTFAYNLFYSVFALNQWKTYVPLVIVFPVITGYFLVHRSDRLAPIVPYALIILTIFELFVIGWDFNTTMKEADILPDTPAIAFLKKSEKQPFRILTTDRLFFPNYGAAYGISDVAGYDAPVYKRYSDLYIAQGGEDFGGEVDARQQWHPNWPLIDFLNVKYVISPRELPTDKFLLVYNTPYFRIFENVHVLPRTFMVYNSEVITDRAAILDQMLNARLDFRKKVIIEEELRTPVSHSPGATPVYSIDYHKYSTDDVVLHVATEKPGILVMSDLYTPDWTVRIDDKQTKLYRANYTYRAVIVPEGKHTVTFHYAPISYTMGATLTLLGLALLLLSLVIFSWRRISL